MKAAPRQPVFSHGLLLKRTELSLVSLLMDLRHTKNDKMGKLNISVRRLFGMIFKSFFPG
jgi:hypothetical protein